MDLFYTKGFHAVGLDEILHEAQLTKTTFYNHFESKEALAKAAVLLRDRWEWDAFKRGLAEKAGYDPGALLLACFSVLDDWFSEPRYQGCLFLMAMTDYPLPQHPVHEAAAQHYLVASEEYEKMAVAAGANDPAGLAKKWSQLIIGAVAAFTVDRDPSAARTAREIARTVLASHLKTG